MYAKGLRASSGGQGLFGVGGRGLAGYLYREDHVRLSIPVLAPRLLSALSRLAPLEIAALAVWPCVLSRVPLDARTARHEAIHTHQQLECAMAGAVVGLGLSAASPAAGFAVALWSFLPFLGPFYLLYTAFFVVGLLRNRHGEAAYRGIPFEREAYAHDSAPDYLRGRRPFAWMWPPT